LHLIKKGIPIFWERDDDCPAIYIENCPLMIPPIEIALESLQTVRDYFEKLDTKAKNTPKSKPSSSPKPRRVKPR